MTEEPRIPGTANDLLAGLTPARYRRLASGLERVELRFGQVLHKAGGLPRHVYFPGDSLVSLVAEAGGGELEVGLVGKEGVVGAALALGHAASPVRALVQGEGGAMRMSSRRFALELGRDRELKRAIDRSIYVAMATAMQIAACNNRHLLAPRLARWLLMVRDRLGRDEFRMTQEFLALMLGVRRAGVSVAAGVLQRRKLIAYSRGNVRILDPQGLGAAACACYKVIRKLERAAAARRRPRG